MSILFIHPGKFIVASTHSGWGNTINYHMHDTYEIGYFKSGSFHVTNGIYETDIESPFLLIHKPFTVHLVKPVPFEPYLRSIINFNTFLLKGIDPSIVNPVRLFKNDLTVIKLDAMQCEKLNSVVDLITSSDNMSKSALLVGVLLKEIEELNPIELSDIKLPRTKYISSVIDYISTHYMEDITSEDLAAMNYISVPKLNRDFRNYTHGTVHELLLRVRMQKAVEFLASDMSVADTAHMCGFVNESHFIRTFKKFYHNTPYRYRKENSK